MSDNDELQFETPLEEEVDVIELPSDKRKIYTELGDPEIESLHGKFKRGKLIVQARLPTAICMGFHEGKSADRISAFGHPNTCHLYLTGT